MRQAYKWGAKCYLANMEIGETLHVDEAMFNWRGMQSIACRLKQEFGGMWQFYQDAGKKYVKRLQ